MNDLSVRKNLPLYILFVLTLLFVVLFVYKLSSSVGSLMVLWLFFVPVGIVLLIVFLVQKLKLRFDR
jgi:hypothetical protein